LLCASFSVRAADYGDVSVTVETILFMPAGRGYNEYRATITNRSSVAHRVTVVLFADLGSDFLGELRREVEVGAASTASVSLLSPSSHQGGAAAILIDGARQRETVMIDDARTAAWTSRSRNRQFLLVSRGIEKTGVMNAEPLTEGFKFPYGDNDVSFVAYQSPPPEWSANWLGYSGFDAVIVTTEELGAMPEPARTALLRYVECGGVLVVAGPWEAPEFWRSKRVQLRDVLPDPDRVDEARRGMSPHEIRGAAELHTDFQNDLAIYSVVFGKVVITGGVPLDRITADEWRRIKVLFEDSQPSPNRYYYNLVHINHEFPVVERIGIPVRGLFAMMLLFVVLIGPVNLFWLARRGRKMRMLWTVPAISLLTCLAVASYVLFGEGFSATTRVEAFTVLDEAAHRATTFGWTGFYSPVTPGDGLHFSHDTAIEVLNASWSPGILARTMDVSNDQHLVSGWVTARVPAFFIFRRSEVRRERLSVRATADGRLAVVNGLGAALRQLWVADRAGRIHRADALEAGAQVTLEDAGLRAAGQADSLRNLYRAHDWLAQLKYVETHPAEFLTPGAYLAVLDASPFVEPGLSEVKERKGRTLIYGLSAEGLK
jgi:hypothetical protein